MRQAAVTPSFISFFFFISISSPSSDLVRGLLAEEAGGLEDENNDEQHEGEGEAEFGADGTRVFGNGAARLCRRQALNRRRALHRKFKMK